MEMNWPVFMYSHKDTSFCSIDRNQVWTRRALKSASFDVFFLDSMGKHFAFSAIKEKKMLFPTPLDLIDFNPKYKVKLSPLLKSELDLESFKKHILGVLQSCRYSLESSGDPDEIMADVKKANSYREIIEMFL